MGVSLAWLGIQTTAAEEVQARLGVSETGESGDYYDFPMAGLMLANHWYLLTAKGCEHPILSERVLSDLSAGISLVACSIEEHVMVQSAAFWRGGKEIWSVLHRGGDYGILDLVVKGLPPDPFNDLRTRTFALQSSEGGADADVDYIADIPLELARSIVGFKHDEVNPGIDDNFRELREGSNGLLARSSPSSAGRWWKPW